MTHRCVQLTKKAHIPCAPRSKEAPMPLRAYRNAPILSHTARLYTHEFRTTMIPKANRAVFDIPCRVHFMTSLTHQTKRTNISTSLAELLRYRNRVRIRRQHGSNRLANRPHLRGRLQLHRFSSNLMAILADSSLSNPKPRSHLLLLQTVLFNQFASDHCPKSWNH